MMKLTAEQRGLSGIGEHIVFSLAKKGSLVGIIVWDPFKAPVLLGYIPTKQFSAHILVSAPLIPPDSLRSVSRGRSR